MKHITFTNVNSESAKYFEQVELYNKMISSELHDTSLQTLAYLINQIDIVKLYIDKDTSVAKEMLEKSRTTPPVLFCTCRAHDKEYFIIHCAHNGLVRRHTDIPARITVLFQFLNKLTHICII